MSKELIRNIEVPESALISALSDLSQNFATLNAAPA
jgi:hypothetical protein